MVVKARGKKKSTKEKTSVRDSLREQGKELME